jgi:hypothetical protein
MYVGSTMYGFHQCILIVRKLCTINYATITYYYDILERECH